jgi:hypothetical protein
MTRGFASDACARRGRAACGIRRVVLALSLTAMVSVPAGAQSNSYNSITLLWTAPGDDGNVGQVSSYQIRFSTSPVGIDTTSWWNGIPAGNRITLGPPLAPAGATDSTTVSGLTSGTTYYFILRALDEVANISGYSNVAAGTTQSCSPPASAPGQFAASADTGEVLVSWNPTTDPLAVSLHLYRSTGTSGPWTLLSNVALGTNSYTDLAVAPGTAYRYRAAWMGAACEGPFTATQTVTTPGTPGPAPTASVPSPSIHVYPNPASGPVRIVIDVTGTSPQTAYIRLFDLNGHWIATLADGTYPPGTSEVVWNRVARSGGTVGPGFYQLLGTVGSTRVSDRLVLVP